MFSNIVYTVCVCVLVCLCWRTQQHQQEIKRFQSKSMEFDWCIWDASLVVAHMYMWNWQIYFCKILFLVFDFALFYNKHNSESRSDFQVNQHRNRAHLTVSMQMPTKSIQAKYHIHGHCHHQAMIMLNESRHSLTFVRLLVVFVSVFLCFFVVVGVMSFYSSHFKLTSISSLSFG